MAIILQNHDGSLLMHTGSRNQFLRGRVQDHVRFTRAFKGLIFPPSEPPGEIMSFGVSPVNYSDSDSDSILFRNRFLRTYHKILIVEP